jgi:hypothetical protein
VALIGSYPYSPASLGSCKTIVGILPYAGREAKDNGKLSGINLDILGFSGEVMERHIGGQALLMLMTLLAKSSQLREFM